MAGGLPTVAWFTRAYCRIIYLFIFLVFLSYFEISGHPGQRRQRRQRGITATAVTIYRRKRGRQITRALDRGRPPRMRRSLKLLSTHVCNAYVLNRVWVSGRLRPFGVRTHTPNIMYRR